MRRHFFGLICAVIFVMGISITAQAEDLIHQAYEMPVFIDDNIPQGPGTHLNGPGDTYAYTFLLNDKYTKSDKYRIKRAIFGVHIIDGDYDTEKGDQKPEWGSITMDGLTRKWIRLDYLGDGYKPGQQPTLSSFYEIESDAQSDDAPPYIYDVTDLLKDHTLKVQVTNLRSDGTIEGTAPFGEFNVLRVGLHVWWEAVK